jgi:hypothetical protein
MDLPRAALNQEKRRIDSVEGFKVLSELIYLLV